MTNKYYIKQLSDYIYLINDDTMCSTYVVIGYKNALIIDAGIASNKELLLPLIKKITNLPIKVVITHAHLDHIGHLYEFDNYYIAKEELDNIKDQAIKEKAIIISDGFMFDLGGISIETYISKGHTTASTLFIDKDNKIVFSELPVLSPEIRDTFLKWLSKALEKKEWKAKTEDGRKYYIHEEKGKRCVVECTDGCFTMPQYTICFEEESQ